MDSSKLITLGIVGVGLYLLYEWAISQCETVNSSLYGSSTCSMLLGTSALPAVTTTTGLTTTPNLTPAAAVAAANSPTTSQTLAALLISTATAAGEPNSLSPDQWSYYYQSIPGKATISPAQFENILGSLGLSDATRSSSVTASQFADALVSQGLSGLSMSKLYGSNWVPRRAFGGWA